MVDICSTIVGVCGEGLRITELPARMAGIRELTRIRYGYCYVLLVMPRDVEIESGVIGS